MAPVINGFINKRERARIKKIPISSATADKRQPRWEEGDVVHTVTHKRVNV